MNYKNKKKFILIGLNELNFDLIEKYIKKNNLKNFKKLLDKVCFTTSETDYKNLEPWIQWPSIYFEKKAKEHGIFRLGDGKNYKYNSIFEKLESKGINVGAICPMNLGNNLKNPNFFLPDPWTETKSSGGLFLKFARDSISSLTKDNARKKFDINSYIKFLFVFLKFFNFKKLKTYFILFIKSLNKKWYRSLFLDFFLNDIFLKSIKKNNTHFSHIFFNSIAHIQHHYFFNSKVFENKLQKNPAWYIPYEADPFEDSLILFDKILEDYLTGEYSILLATGLQQVPYDKKKFYYRLKQHQKFFNFFDIKFKKINELMSRDFIIEFENEYLCEENLNKIKNLKTINDEHLFGDFQKMGNKLFLSFVYNEEIVNQKISNFNSNINLTDYVDFVAIKNGMHDQKGYVFSNFVDLPKETEVHKIGNIILNYYD